MKFMEDNGLVYVDRHRDGEEEEPKSFFQMQAIRSKCDAYRHLLDPGKKAHGFIVSRKGGKVEKGEDYKRNRTPITKEWDPAKIHLSNRW
jgi:hypothetical protein